MIDRTPAVYILASQTRGTIYIGVTSDLVRRVHQHRSGETGGFTSRHDVKRLVHYEVYPDMISAIAREKQLKRWHRDWKIGLIETANESWRDLAPDLGFEPARGSPSGKPHRMDPETSSG